MPQRHTLFPLDPSSRAFILKISTNFERFSLSIKKPPRVLQKYLFLCLSLPLPDDTLPTPDSRLTQSHSHSMSRITWNEDAVDEVIRRGENRGWTHQQTQPKQGHLVIMHKANPDDSETKMKLNIWCSTGTVGSYMYHIGRKKKTQLFRREISTWGELEAILKNPRVHTGKGYQQKRQNREQKSGEQESGEQKTGIQQGKILFFDFYVNFFGFIEPDDGGDNVFVSIRDLTKGERYNKGTRVNFEVKAAPKGPRAFDVSVI